MGTYNIDTFFDILLAHYKQYYRLVHIHRINLVARKKSCVASHKVAKILKSSLLSFFDSESHTFSFCFAIRKHIISLH